MKAIRILRMVLITLVVLLATTVVSKAQLTTIEEKTKANKLFQTYYDVLEDEEFQFTIENERYLISHLHVSYTVNGCVKDELINKYHNIPNDGNALLIEVFFVKYLDFSGAKNLFNYEKFYSIKTSEIIRKDLMREFGAEYYIYKNDIWYMELYDYSFWVHENFGNNSYFLQPMIEKNRVKKISVNDSTIVLNVSKLKRDLVYDRKPIFN